MYSDGIKPNVFVFNSLLAVYARSMNKIKTKPNEITVADRADGRDLLKPPAIREDGGDLGHGSVLVEGDEDVSDTAVCHQLPLDGCSCCSNPLML